MDVTRLRFDEQGLIPTIVQQHDTGEVLMLAWMSAATVRESIAAGETVFWSRSRGERWHKGATSGNTQKIVSLTADCDADVLLVRVDQQGSGACHTGARTCFHHDLGARASVSEPAGGDPGVRASVSEPAGGDPGVRASVSEPAGGDPGVRASVSEPAGGDPEPDDV